MHCDVSVGCRRRVDALYACCSYVLDALVDPCAEELEASFDEHLLCEVLADLHSRALRGLRVVEGFGGEDRGSTDAVATGAGAEEDDLVAQARGIGQTDVVMAKDTHGQSIDQGVALIDGVEDGLAADVRQAQ